jgi:hypothetical protein
VAGYASLGDHPLARIMMVPRLTFTLGPASE